MGISHINPLILKPNKVGISLQNAYAYVLLGPSLNPKPLCPNHQLKNRVSGLLGPHQGAFRSQMSLHLGLGFRV